MVRRANVGKAAWGMYVSEELIIHFFATICFKFFAQNAQNMAGYYLLDAIAIALQ